MVSVRSTRGLKLILGTFHWTLSGGLQRANVHAEILLFQDIEDHKMEALDMHSEFKYSMTFLRHS